MIITLCGSARFEPYFKMWAEVLTSAGHTVFADHQKMKSDEVHRYCIAASEAIMVLNPFAYIGKSTLSELAFAQSLHKRIIVLSSWGNGYGIGSQHDERTRQAVEAFNIPATYGSPITTCDFLSPWDDLLLGEGGARRSALVNRLQYLEAKVFETSGKRK